MGKFTRGLDALAGGFTVGERAHQGDAMKAAMIGLTIAVPLLWKKRLATLALMGATALVSYYFFEELHQREVELEPVEPTQTPSMN